MLIPLDGRQRDCGVGASRDHATTPGPSWFAPRRRGVASFMPRSAETPRCRKSKSTSVRRRLMAAMQEHCWRRNGNVHGGACARHPSAMVRGSSSRCGRAPSCSRRFIAALHRRLLSNPMSSTRLIRRDRGKLVLRKKVFVPLSCGAPRTRTPRPSPRNAESPALCRRVLGSARRSWR